MFVSSYEANVDSKGRVSVPAAFRAALGGGTRVFLWPALDGSGCLEGGGEALMDMYKQTILRLPPQSMQRKALVHGVIARAADLKMDEPGRIKLPEDWVAGAGVNGKVMFAGCIESFQIWEPEAYRAYDARMAEVAAQPDTLAALAAPYDAAISAGGVPGLGPVAGEDA